ncbi:hypothetical protein HYH03_002852 [Edaphochlamys debaryana]|uniref:MYND-type domain-containing protein n=1 Tax=Edaphochlamys debaryana TaxID=47281 RepID=A0A835YCN6_9CHLO|nr:hypothetical protein HYH03_002852 [Edaphochlamys debaryana]|eukprot:KAG2499274.1 hypothetical protein HYH03_002852 [Edaphochlamys debaryana]
MSGEGYQFLELRTVKDGDVWNPDALRAAIAPSEPLPSVMDETMQKEELRRRGWRDPRFLVGYTKDAAYKDLYVYFDAKDHTSPVNVAASKAGLPLLRTGRAAGRDRLGGHPGALRHVAVRAAHVYPLHGQVRADGLPYKPLMTPQELVDTLLFFKDRDAHKVALKRDAARTAAVFAPEFPIFQQAQAQPNLRAFFVSPAGIREGTKVAGHDAQACAACGKPNSIACSLKACSRCKSVWYCDRDCQKQDFPRHKKDCASLAKRHGDVLAGNEGGTRQPLD